MNECYQCVHRRGVPGDCHSQCTNLKAKVRGDAHGIRRGWFCWPFNFDPVWLVSCDGFEAAVLAADPADLTSTKAREWPAKEDAP